MKKPIFIVIHKRTIIYTGIVFLLVLLLPTIVIGVIDEQIGAPMSNLLYGKVIVVDPGHGGIDGGTHFGTKLLEKDINLEIAMKLKNNLKKNGAKVIMTRERDISLDDGKQNGSRHREDLRKRVQIINDSKADIFVSIHVNAIKGNSYRSGPIVFFYTTSEKGKMLAEFIQEHLNSGLSQYSNQRIQLKSLPATGNYYVLRNTKSPGVIVETGFITSEIDRKLLQNDKHQEEIAQQITLGIIGYFEEETNIH